MFLRCRRSSGGIFGTGSADINSPHRRSALLTGGTEFNKNDSSAINAELVILGINRSSQYLYCKCRRDTCSVRTGALDRRFRSRVWVSELYKLFVSSASTAAESRTFLLLRLRLPHRASMCSGSWPLTRGPDKSLRLITEVPGVTFQVSQQSAPFKLFHGHKESASS